MLTKWAKWTSPDPVFVTPGYDEQHEQNETNKQNEHLAWTKWEKWR